VSGRPRDLVRAGRVAVHQGLRRWRLQRCVEALRSVDPATLTLDRIHAIHHAWENQGWAADVSFLWESATRAAAGPGPFLDLGSGLSTVVAGTLAARYGAAVWSLEQDEGWSREMAGTLARLGLDNVVLVHAPLRSYGDFVWFDLRGRSLPPAFSAVFCDGPSVRRREWPDPHFSNWRSGAVPVLQNLGISFGEILLDDAEDVRCAALIQRWEAARIRMQVVRAAHGSFVLGRPDPATAFEPIERA
jgi:hypothetical protein